MSSHENGPDTKIRCRACGGRWKIDVSVCKYCTEGWMTAAQLGAWMRRASGLRPAVRSSSAQAFSPHRALTLERLCKAWEKTDLRLGELILDALAFEHMTPNMLSRLDDDRLVEIVEHYILFGK